MKILVLTFTYPPNKDGVANAAAALAQGLAGRGHEVLVGTLHEAQRISCSPTDNPRVHQFRISGDSNLRTGFCGEIENYRQFVASFDGDIIFCLCWGTAPLELAVREFGSVRAKKVLVSHGFGLHRVNWYPKFPWGLGSWLGWQPYVWRLPFHLRKFDAAVFLSHKADFGRFFDHWVAKKTGYKSVSVIPNCIQLQPAQEKAFPSFRETYNIGNGFLAVCVANFFEHKNQLLAIRAFRKAAIAGSTLVFIGSKKNAYSQEMERVDQELSITYPQGRVLILEGLSREQTEAALRAMDVFVFSATMETQPLVLIEAMACGKPFVATDSGCISEMRGGLVVNSEEELTGAIRRLALEPDLRAELGALGAADFQAHYRPEAFLDAYEALMQQLAHSPSQSV